jgi:transcriptional regulator with XRE-family HTH domain
MGDRGGDLMTETCRAPIKFGVKVCRERKCPELQKNKDTAYPEDAQERCQVFNTMPGTLPCCIKDPAMPPEDLLRHASWSLHADWETSQLNRKRPGPKNCPATCPYKISEQGEVFGKSGSDRYVKKPGIIWKCAFSGSVLGSGLAGYCLCHVLDNPDQEKQIETTRQTIFHRSGSPFDRAACHVVGCPDGIVRCKVGDIVCPVIKLPFIEIKKCPLWRIPAKLLPATIPQQVSEEEPLGVPDLCKDCPWWGLCNRDQPGDPPGTTCRMEEAREFGKACKTYVEKEKCEKCEASPWCARQHHCLTDCDIAAEYCEKKSWHQGCRDEAVQAFHRKFPKALSIFSPKPEEHCGTCGHHKTKKTFKESCPRLPELMFKGGKLSAAELMSETGRLSCDHWITIPDPRCKECSAFDGCQSHDPEKENCVSRALKKSIDITLKKSAAIKTDEKQPDKLELKIIPEFKNLIPGLSSKEFRGLEESLQSEGCRDPIVTWKGIIVDGHNRYQICTALKIPFKTIEREFSDETEAKIWIIKNQFARRNLLPYTRATLAESLKGMIAEKAKENQKIRKGNQRGTTRANSPDLCQTREDLAKIAGVGSNTISRVEFINQKASEEIKQKLVNGEVSINSAYKEIKNPGLFTSETDEWYTPKEIIESVLKVFGGQIDVDPCSNSSTDPIIPAELHFTKEDNGLSKPWVGKIYMNPPYGREIKDWVLKLIEEKEKGNIEEAIALVPARTDTEWFTAFDPHPWCAVKGRLKFSDNPNSAPFPSAIFYLGRDEDLEGLERFFREFCKHGIIYQTIQQQMEAKDV